MPGATSPCTMGHGGSEAVDAVKACCESLPSAADFFSGIAISPWVAGAAAHPRPRRAGAAHWV